MKTKTLLVLLVVALAATVPASAATATNQTPQLIITVDYDNVLPGRPHIFYGWREYLRYFSFRRFCPCWP